MFFGRDCLKKFCNRVINFSREWIIIKNRRIKELPVYRFTLSGYPDFPDFSESYPNFNKISPIVVIIGLSHDYSFFLLLEYLYFG